MGNRLDLDKNQSYYVTCTNNNSGVAKAIEKFVL